MNLHRKKQSVLRSSLLLFLICALNSFTSHSQTPSSFFWEPDFSLGFDSSEKWSHTFGIAKRTLLSEYYEGEQMAGWNVEHLELNHFTKYKTSANTALSFGIRYRFKEIFEESSYDELRFVEQFNISHPNSALDLGHRFRVEQRFKNIVTEHRLRYQFGGSKALSEVFALGLSTEALLTLANELKPSLEQRFVLELSNTSFKDLELSLALDYEMADYNNELENEFFLLTGVSLDL